MEKSDFYLSALSIFCHETFQTCASYLFLFHFIHLMYIYLRHTPQKVYYIIVLCNIVATV